MLCLQQCPGLLRAISQKTMSEMTLRIVTIFIKNLAIVIVYNIIGKINISQFKIEGSCDALILNRPKPSITRDIV